MSTGCRCSRAGQTATGGTASWPRVRRPGGGSGRGSRWRTGCHRRRSRRRGSCDRPPPALSPALASPCRRSPGACRSAASECRRKRESGETNPSRTTHRCWRSGRCCPPWRTHASHRRHSWRRRPRRMPVFALPSIAGWNQAGYPCKADCPCSGNAPRTGCSSRRRRRSHSAGRRRCCPAWRSGWAPTNKSRPPCQ